MSNQSTEQKPDFVPPPAPVKDQFTSKPPKNK